jgi:hypothetical protein
MDGGWSTKNPGVVHRREATQSANSAYSPVMRGFFMVVIALLMLGTLGVLLAGMVGMVRGGGDPARSNRLMRWRVMLQGAALLLFAIMMSLLRP